MMIIRAALTVVLVIGLLAAPLVAEAQQPGRAPVVGVLLLGPPTPTPLTAVFKEGTDVFRARQMLAEKLSESAGVLPGTVKTPKMSPLTSSTMDL